MELYIFVEEKRILYISMISPSILFFFLFLFRNFFVSFPLIESHDLLHFSISSILFSLFLSMFRDSYISSYLTRIYFFLYFFSRFLFIYFIYIYIYSLFPILHGLNIYIYTKCIHMLFKLIQNGIRPEFLSVTGRIIIFLHRYVIIDVIF